MAQGSLDQLAPAEDSGGLLEGLLDGLSGLDLPELPEDEEGDGEGDGSGG